MVAVAESSARRYLSRSIALGTIIGAGALTYSLIEARSYRLRTAVVPVLPDDQDPLLILHVSDLHMTPSQRDKCDWISGLAYSQPDFVVATGDFLAHPDAVGTVVTALGPLLDLPGAFVLGSNDYFAPKFGNPLAYLAGPSKHNSKRQPDLPWIDLAGALTACGWLDLSNRRDTVKVAGRLIDLRGVDDPHVNRDRYSDVAGPFEASADLALGVAHAPYRRVLDPMAADGAKLIMAGHTHGGQVAVPGFGALVTNCDLDRARAKGLSRYHDSWLHVSAGIGTNPYTPIRFACPPEATLLTLVPRSDLRQG